MVLCAAFHCKSRSGRDKVSFFRLPSTRPRIHSALKSKRRDLWLSRLNRKFESETSLKHIRVCSKHFITGKPSDLLDEAHPDWAPSINLGYNSKSKSATARSVQQKLQTSNLTVQSENASVIDNAEISSNDSINDSRSLKMDDSLAPGNAHIVRVVPVAYEIGKAVEQDIESLQEEDSNISENEEEESSLEEEIPEKAKMKLKVQKKDLQEKLGPFYKISLLERRINHIRELRKKDKRKIKTLMQSQQRNIKRIAALKECITILKQQNCIAQEKSKIVKEASPSLLELLGRLRCQNEDKTVSKGYSLEVREFVTTLYSISPDAYRYVRDYFDMVLPCERTLLKWLPKKRDGLTFNGEDFIGPNSADNCIDMQDFNDEDDSKEDF